MRANLDFLNKKFTYFNTLIFKDSLPQIPIELSRGAKTLGALRKQIRYAKGYVFHKAEVSLVLRFSDRYDYPEEMLEDVLIHEMIHLFIEVNRISDTGSHGKEFRRLMLFINEKFGRNIQIRVSLPEDVRLSDNREEVHVIFTCRHIPSERKMFLRCAMTCIKSIYYKLKENPDFDSIHSYVSNDVYFNRFPRTRTLRLFSITDDVEKHLATAREV